MSPTAHDSLKPGILVVDDEQGVRGVLDFGLRAYGFVVWLASSGREALDVYRLHRTEIGIVLSDVLMPDMDGPQMLGLLRQINPEVRCCFMSGGTGRYTEDELLDLGASKIFPKPLSLLELAHALKAMLAQYAIQP